MFKIIGCRTPSSITVSNDVKDVRNIIFCITGSEAEADLAYHVVCNMGFGGSYGTPDFKIECVHDSEATEPVFEAGDQVYVIERDEDNIPVEVSCYMFLARIGEFVVASAWINGIESVEETLAYHSGETRDNYDTDLCVFPLEDCYSTSIEARAVLGEAICNSEDTK